MGPDIESLTRQAFDNTGVILETVGEDLASVRTVTSYFTDSRTDFGAYKTVWGEVFSRIPHTALGVDALAVEELRFEVEAEVALEG